MMNIVVIVLSSILLILIIGLIFKKDFREDVLKAKNDNEAEVKGFKFKGGLFWVIYAATAFGTIYLALDQKEVTTVTHDCTPLLASVNSNPWMAFDTKHGIPVSLEYGCYNKKDSSNNSSDNLNMRLALNDKYQIISTSNFVFGKLDKDSLEKLDFFNDLKFEKSIEIWYDFNVKRWEEAKMTDTLSDRIAYNLLPFKVDLGLDGETVYSVVKRKNSLKTTLVEEKNIGSDDKWAKVINVDGIYYLIRLKSRNLIKGNRNYALFRIEQFSGDIL